MAELKIVNTSNKVVGSTKVDDSIFKAKYRPSLMNDYVVMQRRAWRQGTHSTKTRAEVSGTGKKPFRQKGTGQARQGTLIGPHQVGGGIAFGPKPRDYSSSMNRKAKKEALRVALSQKNYLGALVVIDQFEIASGKTKDAASVIRALAAAKKCLIVGEVSSKTQRAIQNIPTCKWLSPAGLNVYDILNYGMVVITQPGLAAITERLKAEGDA